MINRTQIQAMLEIKRERLLLYHEAEAAILSGQAYEMGDISLTRADLKAVSDMIAKLENEIVRLEDALLEVRNQRSRFRAVIPGGYATWMRR